MSVRLLLTEPWTGSFDARKPLADLDDDQNSHVHGRLVFEIEGQALPRLGFFGPDDVCLNTWVEEFCRIRRALESEPAEYVFDEGEQGQPAFVFRRSGDQVAASVEPSRIGESGSPVEPPFSTVACRADEFLGEIDRFLEEMRTLMLGVGRAGSDWWACRLEAAGVPKHGAVGW